MTGGGNNMGDEQPAEWPGHPSPRKYQLEAFQEACKANRIINLPTGTGKTLVATMLIDHFLGRFPNRVVLFCVNTVALVRQQARYIQAHSVTGDLAVKEITGGEAKWEKSYWSELATGGVLVGTAETFRKALIDHGFLTMDMVSLLIFDEAHHAVKSHPYVSIAQHCFRNRTSDSPHVLGLTASFLHGKFCAPVSKRLKLEQNLGATIWVPNDEDLVDFQPEQRHEFVRFDEDQEPLDPKWAERETLEMLSSVRLDEILLKHFELAPKAGDVYQLLGLNGWRIFVADGLCHMAQATIEVHKKGMKSNPKLQDRLDDGLRSLDSIREQLRKVVNIRQDSGSGMPHVSSKAEALLRHLEELYDEVEEDARCIVFVEQVATTFPLAELIEKRLGRKCRPVSGVNSMPDRIRKMNLEEFASGAVQILVATNSMEEGIDIQACNAVICFDKFYNAKSHVQRSGRARAKDAIIYYFQNDPIMEKRNADAMQEIARRPLQGIERAIPGYVHQVDAPYPFQQSGNDATLMAHNCLNILYEYVAIITKGKATPAQIFEEKESGSAGHKGQKVILACRVPTSNGEMVVGEKDVESFWHKAKGSGTAQPTEKDFKEVVELIGPSVVWSELGWARRRFAYVAVWKLFREGQIDEHNKPTPEALCAHFSEDCEGFLELPGQRKTPQVRFDFGLGYHYGQAGKAALTSSGPQAINLDAVSQLNVLLTRMLKHAPQKGDIVEEYSEGPPYKATLRLVCLDGSPSFCGQKSEGKKAAKQSAARLALDALQAEPWQSAGGGLGAVAGAPLPAGAAHLVPGPLAALDKELKATEKDSKTQLNEFVMSLLGRPVQKGDIEYELLPGGPPFTSTVRLVALEGKLPASLTNAAYRGSESGKRVGAEKSAAEQALKVLDCKRAGNPTNGSGSPAIPVPTAAPPVTRLQPGLVHSGAPQPPSAPGAPQTPGPTGSGPLRSTLAGR